MEKHLKKTIRYMMVLGGIFFAALLIHIGISYSHMERNNTISTRLEETGLPIVMQESNGYLINMMHGYFQEMGKSAAESLTVVSEDRNLHFEVMEYDRMVISASYEVRSLDFTELIEGGEIENTDRSGENLKLNIAISNLLQIDQEYILRLTLNTGENNINYYTRIIRKSNNYSKIFEDAAMNFTYLTLDKERARNLSLYLETNESQDNSNLSYSSLKNSISQISFGDSGMQAEGNFYMTIKELDGLMGEISISYKTFTEENGEKKYFSNSNHFTLKYDPSRVFIMNFSRNTEELFSSWNEENFTEKYIKLGIMQDESIEIMQSEDGKKTAYIAADTLYLYDKEDERNGYIYSSVSERGDGFGDTLKNEMKILSVSDNGDIDFILYGYHNRGPHEGYCGLSFCKYDYSLNMVVEKFFLEWPETFEEIRLNLEKSLYLNSGRIFYFYDNGSVFGIDTESAEILKMAENIPITMIVSSENSRYLSYVTETDLENGRLSLTDLENMRTTDITAAGRKLKVLGFIGEDLVYGSIPEEMKDEKSRLGGDIYDEIHIIGSDFSEKTLYRKDYYLTDVKVINNRIQFNKAEKSGNRLNYTGTDTIISNRKSESREEIGEYTDSLLGKSKMIVLNENIKGHVTFFTTGSISNGKSSTIITGTQADTRGKDLELYRNGFLIGYDSCLSSAVDEIYDSFGYIKDAKGNILWNRADKKNACVLRNVKAEQDDALKLNISGMTLNEALYYVGKGYLVIIEGSSQILLKGYDGRSVKIYYPDQNLEESIGKNEAEAYFSDDNNIVTALVKTKY